MTASQPTVTEACQRAARVLAAGRAERHQIAATGGAAAVAEWAAPGCTEAEKAELTAYWEGLQAQAAGGTTSSLKTA